MSILSPGLLALRRNPRIHKLPPYISGLCISIGLIWLLLLPLNDYSRQTYVSENALLPGQVHTYFGGSEHNILRAYQHEVHGLVGHGSQEKNARLEEILKSSGLKTARQKFQYVSAGYAYAGENLYGILHAPRGDATEAVVLVAAWENMDRVLNKNGLALLLTLARYFKRWSLWSKDIIVLITPDSKAGPKAWVDAYHDAHDPQMIASLPLKSGALQGALVLDYPADHHFESLHISYDGINGQLPNLDLLNTAVAIASGQHGIRCSLQKMYDDSDDYKARLRTMLRGMLNQGLGHGTGPHSSFMPYHVDAITLQTVGQGWQDEMAMGRVVESIFRSLNNLLEHFHQSFFFYLLMSPNRFVSIGTYLPSAMLLAVNFSIMAIALWIQSGRPQPDDEKSTMRDSKPVVVEHKGSIAVAPAISITVVERHLFLPVTFVIITHSLGFIPLYLFNHNFKTTLLPTFVGFEIASSLLPYIGSLILIKYVKPTSQHFLLIKCFSLLLLGMFLSALATINFSLAFLVGLLCSPLTFVGTLSRRPFLAFSLSLLLQVLAPTAIIFGSSLFFGVHVSDVLAEAAFGWDVWGMWTQVVICCVWWPAWLSGAILTAIPLWEFQNGLKTSDSGANLVARTRSEKSTKTAREGKN